MPKLIFLYVVFTKCKRQLRNGFRLENLTWRLWYRQAVMRKQTAPAISNEPDLAASPVASTQLTRSRSLPNLSMHHYAKQTRTPLFHDKPAPPQPTFSNNTTNKFYIDNDADDDDDDTVSSSIDNSCYWASTTCSSSTPSSIMSMEDDSSILFTKQDVKPLSSCGTTNTTKPTSLLSLMLHQQKQQQQQQQHEPSNKASSSVVNHSLRRCSNRFGRLNEWFASANV